MQSLPENINGYTNVGPDSRINGTTYISPDRKAKIICKHITTLSGPVWNCMLFESPTPRTKKFQTKSKIAETTTDLETVFTHLDNNRRYN